MLDDYDALVACEFSARVRHALTAKGIKAISCDLRDTEIDGPHIKGDVMECFKQKHWKLIIAHPPCTYLANSGARWLYNQDKTINKERWDRMVEGTEFFKLMLNAPADRLCVENPIQHCHARKLINVPYTQKIQPWEHGDGETKATCLWLKNLPMLQPTNIVEGRKPVVHHMAPGTEREKNRSRTYPGIAKAMSDAWCGLL